MDHLQLRPNFLAEAVHEDIKSHSRASTRERDRVCNDYHLLQSISDVDGDKERKVALLLDLDLSFGTDSI